MMEQELPAWVLQWEARKRQQRLRAAAAYAADLEWRQLGRTLAWRLSVSATANLVLTVVWRWAAEAVAQRPYRERERQHWAGFRR